MALDILIVDDEKDIRELVAGILSDEGFQTRVAHDSDSAFREIEARRPALLILDIWLQGSRKDGLEILRIVKSRHKELPVIMISGHGNIETAVAAIKFGAYGFIEKPFQSNKLIHLVEQATEAESLRRENEELKRKSGFGNIFTGRSQAITSLRNIIEKVSPTNSRVMISGSQGTGKEIAAKLLHSLSLRASAAFISVNSANIEPERMEPELFGIEQNGIVAKTGLFEKAHGGTLFFDEVADMPLPTQGKILKVLTDQKFTRVGGTKSVQVDVRVVSATSQNLKDKIKQGTFREDLYHRLNVVPIRVPSLSERREDIPLLVDIFLKLMATTTGRPIRPIGIEALAILEGYEWPGNLRQLKNVIERIIILGPESGEGEITPEQLPSELNIETSNVLSADNSVTIMSVPLREARKEFEREYLKVQIIRFSGNISRTATFIGMERSALHRKLKILGIESIKKFKHN
ncbi:MAG: nitrogen assimilation response regulator NtrX [Sphingomonadales bacterium]